ncbi:hypothetical protein NCCP2222_17770 [Sporosarcina sp. NCCP-2222]|uniref:hypothetical protein n=1 Tax=Sporosarcina sp. NCCP-2222 TaxID=2935073 RepID=UPI00207E9CEF|nr:hypothetical protein [Sporosarcina sp. NCCP-2222]GKV55830.1 hypothetical protein NCCP2222_17770 [Sporosarcina sp. NCCP-2222]
MKKGFAAMMIALVLLLGACTKEYWVMKKKDINDEPGVRIFVEELQKEKTDRKGYKLFSISQGKSMVVVSTGTPTKELEVVDVEILDDQTIVTVKEIDAESDEVNPYILIGLERKNGSMLVKNEDGEEYEIGF